jgi:hypothetical protein
VKDEALRRSIMIVAKSYLTRGDEIGEAVHRILMSIHDGAEVLDQVFEDKPTTRKRK